MRAVLASISLKAPEKLLINQVTKTENGEQVYLMDARLSDQRRAQLYVSGVQQCGGIATVATGQSDNLNFLVVRSADSLQQIAGIAVAGDDHEYIARIAQSAHLLGINLVKTVIPRNSGLTGDVAAQMNCRQAGAFLFEAVDQARCQCLRQSR